MGALATNRSCQVLSFRSPIGSMKHKDIKMKEYPNFKIEPISENCFKVKARIKRGAFEKKREATIEGIKKAEKKGYSLVRELEELYEKSKQNSQCSLKTFGDCIEYYETYHRVGKSDQTYFARLKKELGDATIQELPQRLNRFIDYLGTIYTNRGVPYSNGTKNRYRQWARSAVNFCVERELLSENPMKKIKRLPEVPRTRIIKESEIQSLISVIQEHKPYLYPVFLFSIQIPTRKSALMNMRTSWVDIDTNTITIPVEYTKHKKHVDVKPIPPNMIDHFKSIPKESEYVFYRMINGVCCRLTDYVFDGVWKWCKEKAGIDDLHYHDTRHHSATQLLLRRVSEREVMQVGGWKTNMFNTYYNSEGLRASNEVFEVLKVL